MMVTKIYWSTNGGGQLFHNRNGQGFECVTESAGLPGWINANSACWLDYNRDGLLDLFIAGYWSEKIDLFNLTTTQVMPQSFEYATNGGRKYLLRNEAGKFQDVTEEVGIRSTRWTLSVAAACLTSGSDLRLGTGQRLWRVGTALEPQRRAL